MARRISGTGSTPINISYLVATAFFNLDVLDFQLKATGLHDPVRSNPKALYAVDIIQDLKMKLRSLKDQGLWSPA